MEPTTERPFCLDDYEPFLRRLCEGEFTGAVIGGMAVSAWAELFLEIDERDDFDLPIYSKDLDLRGTKAVCMSLARDMADDGADVRGMVAATRKAAPHMGRIFAAPFSMARAAHKHRGA